MKPASASIGLMLKLILAINHLQRESQGRVRNGLFDEQYCEMLEHIAHYAEKNISQLFG